MSDQLYLPAAVPLKHHQVVLGRYGNKKVKSLTPAMDIYKKVRSKMRRSGNLTKEELDQMKTTLRVLLQEKEGHTEVPPITFLVDIMKAKQTESFDVQELDQGQIHAWTDDGSGNSDETIYFVEDMNDFFLKADLATKRHEMRLSVEEKIKIERLLLSEPSLPEVSLISESVDPDGVYPRSNSMNHSLKFASISCYPRTPSMDHSSLTMDIDILDHNSDAQFKLTTVSPLPVYKQMEQACCRWICQSDGVETIERKTNLAKSYTSYVRHYQALLDHNNPFQHASLESGLRGLNESVLVQVANTIGNAMVRWFEKHPTSCLADEEHSWIDELNQSSKFESIAQVRDAADYDSEEESSVGSFSGSEDEIQATLSDDEEITLASYYLNSQFSLGSDTAPTQDSSEGFEIRTAMDAKTHPVKLRSRAEKARLARQRIRQKMSNLRAAGKKRAAGRKRARLDPPKPRRLWPRGNIQQADISDVLFVGPL